MRDYVIKRVIRPLYAANRWSRRTMRPAFVSRRESLEFHRSAWEWPRPRQEEWILAQLRAILRHARTTPFYRDRFDAADFDPERLTGFADFCRIPPLERTDILAHGHAMLAPDVDMQQVWRDSTGGSTGQPTVVLKGPRERGWSEAGQEFFMSRIGVPPGTRTGFLWGHHLDPVTSDAWRDRIRTLVENGRWYDCFRLSPDVLEQYHRDLCNWRPGCIIAYAGALGALARTAGRSSVAARYPRQCFVTGAEKLERHDREMITEVYGRPVHERYGSRDVALMGFQSDPHSTTFEIDWANVLIEPEGVSPLSPILVTKLNADAMPMIRYRVGDIGRFPVGSRPGHPVFELEEVVGREVDRLRLPDGGCFDALGIPHLLKDYPVLDFQLVQSADYSVTLRIVGNEPLGCQSEETIGKILRLNLPGVNVRLERCREIERTTSGKRRLVISHAPQPEESRT
jgi:phenylacetate-CoA ligase